MAGTQLDALFLILWLVLDAQIFGYVALVGVGVWWLLRRRRQRSSPDVRDQT